MTSSVRRMISKSTCYRRIRTDTFTIRTIVSQQGIQVQTCNRTVDINRTKEESGKGLPRAITLTDNAIDYVQWDDPNELVDRLRLRETSRQADHNAHDNEMLSIIEELREAGIIIN